MTYSTYYHYLLKNYTKVIEIHYFYFNFLIPQEIRSTLLCFVIKLTLLLFFFFFTFNVCVWQS